MSRRLPMQMLIAAVLVLNVAAQDNINGESTTSQPTITAIVGSFATGLAASVLTADNCNTILEMQCTGTDGEMCSEASDLTMLLTKGSTDFEFAYSTSTLGGIISVYQSCGVDTGDDYYDGYSEYYGYDYTTVASPISQVTCTVSASLSMQGQTTSVNSSATVNVNDNVIAQIPITAGAEKLPAFYQPCTSTTESSSAAATRISQPYKVMVPIGAALVGAIV